MPHQSELQSLFCAMTPFAQERLLTLARGLARNFPAPATLVLVENCGDAQGFSRSVNGDINRRSIRLVRKAVDG